MEVANECGKKTSSEKGLCSFVLLVSGRPTWDLPKLLVLKVFARFYLWVIYWMVQVERVDKFRTTKALLLNCTLTFRTYLDLQPRT